MRQVLRHFACSQGLFYPMPAADVKFWRRQQRAGYEVKDPRLDWLVQPSGQ
jgi:hypothetical protein